jgi:hypothetical protein
MPTTSSIINDKRSGPAVVAAGLLLAVVWTDAIGVTLAGFAVAGAIHTANHTLDHHLGGHPSDPWGLGALTLLALLGLIAQARRTPTHRHPPAGEDT